MHKGHSDFLSLNRGTEAYLFCMGSLAESAIAYRAECALMGGGVINAQRKGERKAREEGVGSFCWNSMSSLMPCLSLAGHRFILDGK